MNKLFSPVSDMGFYSMAFRVAFNEHIGYNPDILDLLTDDMLREMDIRDGDSPFDQGVNSVVFINGRNNVVVFTFRGNAKNVADKIKASPSGILPEIYSTEIFSLEEAFEKTEWTPGSSVVYAIEMQKLKPLSRQEQMVFNQLIISDYAVDDLVNSLTKIYDVGQEDVKELLVGGIIDKMRTSVEDLINRSEGAGVTHDDLHGQNVGWDEDGELRFIDLDDVNLDEAGLDQFDAA